MRCSGFLATSSPLSISISISITLPHTDPPWKKGKKETWAHEPILNNPEKTDEGFPSHSQPALSLHLFLCRLSVLIRPSVIPAPISCFLSHIPASLVFSYPSSLLVWRKDNEWLSFTALSLSLSLSLSSDLYLYLKPHHTLKSYLPVFLTPFLSGHPHALLSAIYKSMCAVALWVFAPANEAGAVWTVKMVSVWSLMFCWLYTGRKKNRRWRQHDRWKDRQRQHGQIVGGGGTVE